ncbi:hypothetical protein ACQEV9_15585 [Streptomyces chartreusis]|uniref:deoxynucleotide monophosphate kinase family protein n=1 Tax=Streptomyces chartreusis TaxID=1969 RepID=UPI003D8D3D90
MRNVAFIGKARSGKDSAAGFLVRTRHYTRLAFADPLKEMAEKVDPFIPTGYDVSGVRLSALIRDVGWDYAKDHYPEVRRILQHMGQTQREFDEDYWVKAMRRKLNNAEAWNLPVVVTDVRYPNEANMLRARGFRLIRVVRPAPTTHGLTGLKPIAARYMSDTAAAHESETALDDYEAHQTILNTSTLDELYQNVAELAL